MTTIWTFDVFDTCLTRLFAFPSDIFCEVASTLEERLRPALGRDFIEIFRSNRFHAEIEAQRRTGAEETTLQDIWRQLGDMIPALDIERGLQEELATERRCIRPNEKLRKRIQALRNSGKKIAFISDTHMPEWFVRERLTENGFLADGDGLYVSSKYGVTKRSGGLFKAFIRSAKVNPREVIHVGDNPESDLRVPLSLGIKVDLLREAQLQPPELSFLGPRGDTARALSRFAGNIRCFRLKDWDEPQASVLEFTGSFLAPFLIAFSMWVLKQARADGVRRLYFLSRDCYLLWHVASKFAVRFGIECEYLQVSRQALGLPSATDISEAGMPWMRRSFEESTVEQLLAKVELGLADVGPQLSGLGRKAGALYGLTSREWNEFWKGLNEEPVRSRIQESIAKRRVPALKYFALQGLLDGTPSAVVDLGWHLGCQSALQALLQSDATVNLKGYYLGLRAEHADRKRAGEAQALFYDEVPDRRAYVKSPAAFHHIDMLEHLLGVAPHGTVHHYDETDGGAVAVCASLSESARKLSADLLNCVERFCDFVGDSVAELGDTLTTRQILDGLIQQCLEHPNRVWLDALCPIVAAGDQNNLGAKPIATPLTWGDLAVSCLPWRWRRRFGTHLRPWPEATLCMSSPMIRAAASLRDSAFALKANLVARFS